MSSVPPNILGASAQAGFVAAEASRLRDADRTGQTQIAANRAEKANDAANSVETSDGDTAVFADAEGAGGQGRAFGTSEEEPTDERSVVEPQDDASQESTHLDIQI